MSWLLQALRVDSPRKSRSDSPARSRSQSPAPSTSRTPDTVPTLVHMLSAPIDAPASRMDLESSRSPEILAPRAAAITSPRPAAFQPPRPRRKHTKYADIPCFSSVDVKYRRSKGPMSTKLTAFMPQPTRVLSLAV